MAGTALLLASCDKEPLNESIPQPQEPAWEVELNDFTYESLMESLCERPNIEKVALHDGGTVHTISLTVSADFDPEQAGMLVFKSAPRDSVELFISDSYASFRMTQDGRSKAWIAYNDQNVQKAAESRYASLNAQTRSGAPVIIPGNDGTAMSLDLTALTEMMENRPAGEKYFLPEVEDTGEQIATRGMLSFLFKKATSVFRPKPQVPPQAPTIHIYMMKERGANPLQHEMNWQVDDAITSLKNVQPNAYFYVHTVNCDFKGSNDANGDLYAFRSWVWDSSYKHTEGVFLLCRWGGWGDSTLGMSFLGDYDVNNDRQAFGVTCTNAWYRYVMAHEVGHIFGADHVDMHWYDHLYNTDLMCPGDSGPFKTWKHTDSNNRAEIYRRLTYR